MAKTINSHNWDDMQKISLNDLQENWKDKLSALSDDELKELKQQALDAEDYDMCKLIHQEQTIRKENIIDEESSFIQDEINDDKARNRKISEELKKQLNFLDLSWFEGTFYPCYWWLFRKTSDGNWLHWCEIKLDSWEHIVIPAKYKKVEMWHDWFLRISNDNWLTQWLISNKWKLIIPEWNDYAVRWTDRSPEPEYHKAWYAYIYNKKTKKWEWINNEWEHFDFNTMQSLGVLRDTKKEIPDLKEVFADLDIRWKELNFLNYSYKTGKPLNAKFHWWLVRVVQVGDDTKTNYLVFPDGSHSEPLGQIYNLSISKDWRLIVSADTYFL